MPRDDDPPVPPKPPAHGEIDRAAILARRRYFVATALAGLAVGACDAPPAPQTCLKMMPTPTAPATDTAPAADAQPSATASTTTPSAPADTAPTAPATTTVAPPATTPPQVCLKIARPRDAGST